MEHAEAIAIRVRHLQGVHVDAQELESALAAIQSAAPERPQHERNPWRLTRMEREVLQMITDGETQMDVAAKRDLHIKGINKHIRNAREKMSAGTTAHAAVLWDRFVRA